MIPPGITSSWKLIQTCNRFPGIAFLGAFCHKGKLYIWNHTKYLILDTPHGGLISKQKKSLKKFSALIALLAFK
jgi:hypothetical protein